MATLVKKDSLLPSWTGGLLDVNRFFGPRLLDLDGDFPSFEITGRIPSVNITESEKEFEIEMAAPGLDRKDIKVEVENNMLCISSEKEENKKEEKKNYTRREYSYNSFSRKFSLPENSLPDKVNAKYENGILHVVLPKKEVTVSKMSKEIKVS